MDVPFISVPTAASVDGFTSKGAPLILKGTKKTIQTASPMAVFADIAILKDAPKELTAAGFGDIMGKYTSLVDWEISRWIGGEPYNERADRMTRYALDVCVNNLEDIAERTEFGIECLIRALIESGLVMLILDFSRPASGGEHHLSHYWEMDLLQNSAKQHLHGAKVGVTTTIITDLYKKLSDEWDAVNKSHTEYKGKLKEHWSKIEQEILAIPETNKLKEYLRRVGGPDSPAALGRDSNVVRASLNEAYLIRDRCTGLMLLSKHKRGDISYPFMNQPLPLT
ncbi:sn-glycerol-1-phosphate dehydrogenase [Gracilibacillus sp. YIM 98692]|uniref:sn-glycerol-1-phosphate dehydrogenase n=1 Tax=Gracilibacillus sp. YIM 98692 TaxID=2663532 RepID=UPI0013D04935|nr:sn-glycerol-1-phosphate dehydrogenase [Gracilibacillus sp. YIM 98692]